MENINVNEMLIKIYQGQQEMKNEITEMKVEIRRLGETLDEVVNKELPSMKAEIRRLGETLDEVVNKELPSMKAEICTMKTEMHKMEKTLNEVVNKELPSMKAEIRRLGETLDEVVNKELPEVKGEIRKLSKTVAKMEVSVGDKVGILFDAFKSDDDRIAKNQLKLEDHDKILERHDNEIFGIKYKLEAG